MKKFIKRCCVIDYGAKYVASGSVIYNGINVFLVASSLFEAFRTEKYLLTTRDQFGWFQIIEFKLREK